jgi:hypothetical protein
MKIYSNFIPAEYWEKGLDEHLKSKPITIFNDFVPPSLDLLKENPYNILLIMEPNQLFNLHSWAIQNSNQFAAILTWGQEILDNCENSMFFPFGISWLDQEYVDSVDSRPKKFEVSFLCGAKKRIEGHFLRHRLFERGNEITIPKKWFYTLPDYEFNGGNHSIKQYEGKSPGSEKKICWDESMFSICVENSSNYGYHTEKIIDAFLSKTVPIYWGCKNIYEFYDKDGIIICNDENEIIEAVNKLTEEDYHKRKEAIETNYEMAKYFADLSGRLNDVLNDIVIYNKL